MQLVAAVRLCLDALQNVCRTSCLVHGPCTTSGSIHLIVKSCVMPHLPEFWAVTRLSTSSASRAAVILPERAVPRLLFRVVQKMRIHCLFSNRRAHHRHRSRHSHFGTVLGSRWIALAFVRQNKLFRTTRLVSQCRTLHLRAQACTPGPDCHADDVAAVTRWSCVEKLRRNPASCKAHAKHR